MSGTLAFYYMILALFNVKCQEVPGATVTDVKKTFRADKRTFIRPESNILH